VFSIPFLIFVLCTFILILISGYYFRNYLLQPWYIPGSIQDGTTTLLTPLQPLLSDSKTPLFAKQPEKTDTLIQWSWLISSNISLHCYRGLQNEEESNSVILDRVYIVIVIHGGPGIPSSEPWKALRELENKYPGKYLFVYYHQRGCGKSTRFVDTFSSSDPSNYFENSNQVIKTMGIQEHVADIERLRKLIFAQLEVYDRPVILLGRSFGAYLAGLYAIEFPEQVLALITISPANLVVIPPPESTDLFRSVRKILIEKNGEIVK